MEALIIQTGTPPGPDGIALWVTMKKEILPCIHLDREIIAVMVLVKGINKF